MHSESFTIKLGKQFVEGQQEKGLEISCSCLEFTTTNEYTHHDAILRDPEKNACIESLK